MSNITYDYPASKAAHEKLVSEVENYKATAKQTEQAGQELVAENTAEGVQATMTQFAEQQAAIVKVMDSLVEESAKIVANAKEFHLAMGGVE